MVPLLGVDGGVERRPRFDKDNDEDLRWSWPLICAGSLGEVTREESCSRWSVKGLKREGTSTPTQAGNKPSC